MSPSAIVVACLMALPCLAVADSHFSYYYVSRSCGNDCSGQANGLKLTDPTDCHGYFVCQDNEMIQQYCAPGEKFIEEIQSCVVGKCPPCNCDGPTTQPTLPTPPTSTPSPTSPGGCGGETTESSTASTPGGCSSCSTCNTTPSTPATTPATTPGGCTSCSTCNTTPSTPATTPATTPGGCTSCSTCNTTPSTPATTPGGCNTSPSTPETTPGGCSSCSTCNSTETTALPTAAFPTPVTPEPTPSPITPAHDGSTAGPAKPDCALYPNGERIPDEQHCRLFWQCLSGRAVQLSCEEGMWYDRQSIVCNLRADVKNCPAMQD